MRLPRALNPNENPAQFGIFFSANRPRSHRVFHRAIGNSDRLFRSIGCNSPRRISNHDYSLRVEYGARRFCSHIRMYAGRAYSTLRGAANFLVCSIHLSPNKEIRPFAPEHGFTASRPRPLLFPKFPAPVYLQAPRSLRHGSAAAVRTGGYRRHRIAGCDESYRRHPP